MSISITDNEFTKKISEEMIHLTDSNGKIFELTLNDIIDVSTKPAGNASILEDGEATESFSHEISITDSLDNTLDDANLIKQIKDGEVVALEVLFEATHTGLNKNSVVYDSASMSEDYKSWMFPFPKPLIKNHDTYLEPIGRVSDARFNQSEFDPNKDTIDLTFKVTDQDAMIKFADGRYRTMSIGATASTIGCATCGKDILKDGVFKFCGHYKGQVYANKVAVWTTRDLEYKEGSIVNTPADQLAQVKRIKAIKLKGGNTMGDEENEKKETTIQDSTSIIDDILNDNSKEETPVINPVVEENKEGIADSTPEAEAPVKLEDQLAEAQEKIKELENQIKDFEKEVGDMKNQAVKDQEKISELEVDVTDKEKAIEKFKSASVSLAKMNKDMLISSLMALKPELNDEELLGKTAKEISVMISEAKDSVANPKRIPGTIENPGLQLKDNNTIEEDEATEVVEKPKYTMKDMEDVLCNFFK